MRSTWLLALLLALPALAGCIGSSDEPDLAENALEFEIAWSEKALAFGEDHDHNDRAQHRGLSTPNFDVLGYSPLNSTYYDGAPAGAYFCGDAKEVEDGRRIAAVESRSDVGFALADVTDPANPVWIGELVMQTTRIYDLAVAPNGQNIVLATADLREDPVPNPELASPNLPNPELTNSEKPGSEEPEAQILWRSACSDEPVLLTWTTSQAEDTQPRPMSLVVVDISDPAAPAVVESQPLPGNGHSIFATEEAGMSWLVVTTTRYPTPGPTGALPGQNQMTAYAFYELAGDGAQASASLLSIYRPQPYDEPRMDDGVPELGPRGHDAWLHTHPGTGGVVAYLAGGDRFSILDMSDPSNPEPLGAWQVRESGSGGGSDGGTVHSALPLEQLWDGKHYTIIGPEFAGHPEGYPSGLLYVIDTTDPTDPEPVAAWTLPHELDWSGTYMFSNHYYSVVDETLFVSMYHGGIWAVDLSPIRNATDWVSLPSIGVYLPDIDPPTEPADSQRWAPTVEEALAMPDGTLVTFDGNSGLYTLGFDATRPAPAPTPWEIPVHE